ncbi:hypothetical protein [Capybara microvirus Cap3_SP_535]|nr:hypothetical protein [Capybara microvirus Cap3_SP_535]
MFIYALYDHTSDSLCQFSIHLDDIDALSWYRECWSDDDRKDFDLLRIAYIKDSGFILNYDRFILIKEF